MGSDVVLYYTHYLSATIQKEIYRIREELENNYRLAVIAFAVSPDLPGEVNGVPIHCYNTEQICQLPYGRKIKSFRTGHPGHVDLAPLMFFREHPDYAHYWIIEHDVRFSGNWQVLFGDLGSSKADLLCTTLQTWA